MSKEQKMTDEAVEPIVKSGRSKNEMITVKVGAVERYQARMEEVNERQKQSINRLLKQIEELQNQNRSDAGEIARLTGLVVQAEEETRQVRVQLDRAVEERQVAIDAVKDIQSLLSEKMRDFTTDGEHLTTQSPAEVMPRYDAEEAQDEADVALSASPPIVPGPMPLNEERPASSWDTSGDDSSGRHASLT